MTTSPGPPGSPGSPAGPRSYLDGLADRLTADGCTVSGEQLSGATALVGVRSDFKLSWMATRLHLFTIAIEWPHVDAASVEGFADECMGWALKRKLSLPRGLQVGVALYPVMVSPSVDPAAAAWAAEKQRVRFAAMSRPVTVDVGTGQVSYYAGKPALGRIYAGHLITKARQYFPPQT